MTWLDDPEDRFPHLVAEGKPMPAGELPVIWFDNPDRRNALIPADLETLTKLIERLNANGQPVILAGRGEAFCSGFDLALCQRDAGAMRELLHWLSRALRALAACDVPVVIAAHGAAIAGGCALLSGADWVVTNRTAKLGYPVVRLGLSPAISAPYIPLPGGSLRERMLDPAHISGDEALRIGLVSECVADAGDVLPAALAAARALAGKPRHAYAATKQWLRECSPIDLSERALAVSLATGDHAETRERLTALRLR